MKNICMLIIGTLVALPVAATASTTPFMTAPAAENYSAEVADTSSRTRDAYAMAPVTKPITNTKAGLSESKTANTRSNVKLVNVKASDRKKMVSNTSASSFLRKSKIKKSDNLFLLKLKAETKKTRKEQDRFVRKRINSNASRFYRHYSLRGIF